MKNKNIIDRFNTKKSDINGLTPLKPIDISKINDFDEMAQAMALTSFGGRKFGEAVDVAYKMFSDKNCFRVGTFSGAMTPAKMSYLICDMIDSGMLHCIVSTGALITHGLVEGYGMLHYKSNCPISDDEAYAKKLNRIYDTYEPEDNLDETEKIITDVIEEYIKKNKNNTIFSSAKLTKIIGKHLNENSGLISILSSAYKNNVPVIIPAFTDSEFGLDFAIMMLRRKSQGKNDIIFDPFNDLFMFKNIIKEQFNKEKKFGIFTIGGGVPRNWAQQVAPFLDILRNRCGEKEGCCMKYNYGVRICPEPVYWGGLSGCTYKEGVTWGKFASDNSENGLYAEILSDATLAWPFLLKAVKQRIEKNNK